MNMEQINMLMQMMMQQGQVSTSAAGKDSDKDTFQDLMAQKQESASSSPSDTSNQQTQSKPVQEADTVQKPQEDVKEIAEDVQQVLAAMQFQPYVIQNAATQPMMQENADMLSNPLGDVAAVQTLAATAVADTVVSTQQTPIAQADVQVPQQTTTVEQWQISTDAAMPQENVQQGAQTTSFSAGQQNAGDNAASGQMLDTEQSDGQNVAMVQQEQPVFQNVETVPVKVGDATPTVDMEAPDVEKQLADTIQTTLKTVGDKVEIQLQPENLGRITIELAQHGSKLGIVIYAENAKTTSLLAQNMGNLGALLEDRTGQAVQIQVQQQEPEQPQYDGHNQQNRQQQEQQSQSQRSKAEQDSFLGQLRLGLYQSDVI